MSLAEKLAQLDAVAPARSVLIAAFGGEHENVNIEGTPQGLRHLAHILECFADDAETSGGDATMRLSTEDTPLLDIPREANFGDDRDINVTFPSLVIRCLSEADFRK